ncbi:Protein C25H3.3 [Aphelenchoides avenae]|nr:Protein C25H3.3 [Aphelenchus avenae]
MSRASKYYSLLKDIFKGYATAKNFQNVASGCRLVSADEGKVTVEFEVTEAMTNPFGGLHGGFSATLVDIVTTTALIATERQSPGVSVDLHMTYLNSAKIGDTVVLDASVIKAGRSTAFTRAELYRKHDMKPIATGLHTKALLDRR